MLNNPSRPNTGSVAKTADQIVNNTAWVNDTELFLAVLANRNYFISFYFGSAHPNAAVGFQFRWNVPAGATIQGFANGMVDSQVPYICGNPLSAGAAFTLTNYVAQNHIVTGGFILKVGATAGTLQLQFGMGAPQVIDETLKVGSGFSYTLL
jgi:hypothetical protein